MKVSIALATYNGARYLQEQLDSLAAQSRLPDELVICDDGSSDSTGDIVANFAARVSFPVRFIQNKVRLGSTKNFEKAIGLSIYDIIALCDQDDVWLPDKLARQAAVLEQDLELGGVFSDAQLIDEQSRPTGEQLWDVNELTTAAQKRLQQGDALPAAVTKRKVLGCTTMFRASLVDRIIPIPSCWEHDGWIAWMIAVYSRIDLIPETLLYYRIHPAQQFGVRSMSLLKKIEISKRTGAKEYLNEVQQLMDLQENIRARHGSQGELFLDYIEGRIACLRLRANLPSNRLMRLRKVLPEIRNYHRFFTGWRSIVKDLTL